MKNKNHEDNNCIDSILKLTKSVVQNTDAFHNFYIHKNNKLFSKQLPLLIESKSSLSLIKDKSKNKNKNKLIKKIPFPLKYLRNEVKRSNKIPLLYPINNNKGEVIPLITVSNEIKSRNLSLNKSCNSTFSSLGSFPIQIQKKSNSFTNIKNNSLDEFQKDFFSNDDYNNITYNEDDIFKNKEKYNKLIKEKINFLKNEKNVDQTCFFQKLFYYGKRKKKLELCFNSLVLNFEDISSKKNNNHKLKNLELNCPFQYLPLFYYKGYETFKKLLSYIIKFDEKGEKISIDEEAINTSLKILKDYQIENSEKKKKNIISLNLSPIMPPLNHINHMNSSQIKNLLFNNNNKIKSSQNEFIVHSYDNNKNVLKKYNYYSFIWTTISKTYKVTIILPLIDLLIPQNSVSIKHFIDFELLFYLYNINFENWDFYITKYLSNFKKFRYLLEKLDSYYELNNQTFFLREPKSKFFTFSQEILFSIHTDENNNNEIIKLKSFYIVVTLTDINSYDEKEYHIYFNFTHLVKLIEIGKHINKLSFLFKFIEVNKIKNSLTFNYKKLDDFDVNLWINNIKKFNGNHLKKKIQSIERLSREYHLSQSHKIKIEFKKPIINIIKIENKIESSKNYHFTKEFEDEFVVNINNKESINWSKLINRFLGKMIEIITLIPHSLSSSPPRKKNSKNGIGKKVDLINNNLNSTFHKNKKKENRIFLFHNNFKLDNIKMKKDINSNILSSLKN